MNDHIVISYKNTHIDDSYQIVTKRDMCELLGTIREQCNPDMAIAVRSMKSLVCEWRVHNLLYYLHLFRCHTKDVDMERHQAWWREVLCRIASFLYFWDR